MPSLLRSTVGRCAALMFVGAAVLATPVAAGAAVVETGMDSAGHPGATNFTAAPGEANNLTVTGTNHQAQVTFVDTAATLSTTASNCSLLDAHHVTCTYPNGVTVRAGDGDDHVEVTGLDYPTVLGGPGNDTIDLTYSTNASADGGDGNDFIGGGAGNNTLNGNGGNDIISGGPGRDVIHGGDGADEIHDSGHPAGAPDVLDGGAGNDHIYLTPYIKNDKLICGAGTDTIFEPAVGTVIPSGCELVTVPIGGVPDDVLYQQYVTVSAHPTLAHHRLKFLVRADEGTLPIAAIGRLYVRSATGKLLGSGRFRSFTHVSVSVPVPASLIAKAKKPGGVKIIVAADFSSDSDYPARASFTTTLKLK